MKITLDEGYNAMCDFVYLGYVGEVNAREISILDYIIPEATAYKLKIEYPDRTVYELPIKNGICSLGASIFKTACEVKCQIVAYAVEGEIYKLVRKSDVFKQEIRSSIDESGIPSYEESLDALDKILQYESNSKEYAERAEAAAIKSEESESKSTLSASNASKSETAVAGYAQTAKTNADSTTADKQAVQTLAEQVTADKTTVAENTAKVAEDRTAAENAAQTAQAVAESIPADYSGLANDVSQLKEDIDDLLINVKSKNLLDKTKVTTSPYNYINPNGDTETYGNNFVTDYIPVESGKVVTLSRYLLASGKFIQSSYVSICMFDADKNVKSGGDYNKTTCTIPNGVAFVRITLNKSYFLDVDSMVELTDDGTPTTYEPYSSASKKLTDEIIESSQIATVEYVDDKKYTMSLLTDNIGCSLPKSEYFMTVGIEESWYTDSFATPKGFFVNMYSGSQADRHDGKYTFSNVSSYYGNNAYLWNLYDMLLNLVEKEANTGTGYARNCKSLNLQDCSLLCIGDSTVGHDVMTAKIKSFFTENGKNVTLLGTLGDGKGTGNNNEGRAGWTTSDYFTNKTYDGVVNPFYNPDTETFDFKYYMNQQGYTSVDFVAIQLGINDLYNFDDTKIISTWENIKAMIDSIHTFNPSVKVILNLPTTPNADQSKHAVFEPLYRNRIIRYCEYATTKAKELYPTTRVRISYNHLILNPDTDIRDNVHPTNGGYEKMGLEVCNQINCWQNS